jgi:hypothetical protein
MIRRFDPAAGNKGVLGLIAFCSLEERQIRTAAGSHGIKA